MKTNFLISAFCFLAFAVSSRGAAAEPLSTAPATPAAETKLPNMTDKEAALYQQLRSLNQIPEDQLNEKTDPAMSILKSLYDPEDPDFSALKKLLGRADVRGPLNPSAKCVLANILSKRWDCFSLAGNLWLAGLRSANPEFRAKARQQLATFIQSPHIPVLIDMLKTPGVNEVAYEVLKEVTGQMLDPNMNLWLSWWNKAKSKIDLVGRLLEETQTLLAKSQISPFEQEKLWYLPPGVNKANTPYAKRSSKEKVAITRWNEWANTDVKKAVDDWATVKPLYDRIRHQADVRVTNALEGLVKEANLGDYASVLLAWRGNTASLNNIQQAYSQTPTVGRALARGYLGDKTALGDLLEMIKKHLEPLTLSIRDENVSTYVAKLQTVGIIPAEQAFQLLSHHDFGLEAAATRNEKKKAVQQAQRWFDQNQSALIFDSHRGYFVAPAK